MKNKGTGGATFIAAGVNVQGDFTSDGDLTIEGSVTGNVAAAGELTIGSTAVIDADVAANNALISGRIKGSVRVEGTTELTASAVILGDLETRTLVVASGALVNGRVTMPDGSAPKKQEKHAEEPQA